MSDPIQRAVEAERARALAQIRAERKAAPPTPAARYAAFEMIRDEMSEALAYRIGGVEPERDGAIAHVGTSFREMVRMLMGFRGG